MRTIILITAVFLLAGQSGLRAAEPPVEIDVLVHAGGDTRKIDASHLADIFRGTRTTLPDGSAALPFNLPPSNKLRVEFDQTVLRMSPYQVGRYWVDQRIRGAARPPRQVSDPALMGKLIAKLPGAIGYVPAGQTIPGTRVIARIRNQQVIEP